MPRSTAVLIAIFAAAPAAAQQTPTAPRDLDAYVTRTMQAFQVPGIALAIVKDGRVVVARGYGVRRLGDNAPVDAETRFGIASNTKAFTATALGLLVEEGRIEWDAPVTRYLPWFALSDPYVTRELTVRDLLVHRSGLGLGAGDLLWWPPTTYDRREIARRLRHIPLATSFRSAYAYDNVLYTVAGELIQEISGLPWEQFIQTRILDRVGMRGATVRHSDQGGGDNVATPHAPVEGRVRVVNPFASDNTNPAGGINAGAADMARWLMVQLDSGRLADGSRLFTPRTTRELWSVVTPLRPGNPPPELTHIRANFVGYGLGLNLRDYRGYKLVTHTGGLPGYVSRVMMVPEARLGIAVLTNMESGEAFEAITWRILDYYLGAPPTDYVAALQRIKARMDSTIAAADAGTAARRDSTSRPSLPPERYAGTYTDAWYGDVGVALEQGRLVVRFAHSPSLVGDLVHWQYDTFVARWHDRELRADAFMTFQLNADGSIDRVKMAAVSPSTDFSFDFQDLDLRPARRR